MDAVEANAPASLFRMDGVSKRYGGVRALEKAHLVVEAGRIHAILGENGAGKSTLIKIMAGVVAPDEGRMLLDGREVRFTSPAEANAAGIACIFQELSLVPDLSVADNIAISHPPRRFGLIDRSAQRAIAEAALARAGAEDIHPRALVKDLPLSRRQMVEIAKALAWKPRILILDEATSALTASDVAKVFSVLKRLRSEGLALLYISHRMHEIAELADECTVFRNGRNVASYKAGTRTDNEVVEMMIGREYKNVFPPKPKRIREPEPPALKCRQLGWTDRLRDISFSVAKGEVVGLGGLDGQGQRNLLLALFGVLRGTTGTVLVNGAPVSITSPANACTTTVGMALIPEDRKTEALRLPMTVRENLSFAVLDRVSKSGIIDRDKEERLIDEMVQLLDIKTAGLDIPVAALSGGNQQKVVIAKWLMRKPRIILLNDPTRGIDVGTKQEIYQLLRRLADAGAAILFYSTDYDELIGCCDRVLVLYDGRIVRELEGDRITQHALIASALNVGADQATGAAA
jgi:ribose transport system ATP-binding protein